MDRLIDWVDHWLRRYERKCQERQMNRDAWREIEDFTRLPDK